MNDPDPNVYAPPESDLESGVVHPAAGDTGLEYAGFWVRTGAVFIDTILLLMISQPILYLLYGSEYFLGEQVFYGFWDIMLSWVFPAVAVIAFWRYRSATPGKMAVRAVIVDAATGNPPSMGQLIGRYFAYIVSTIPLGLGYLWAAWDPQKQTWHDKLARTFVVRPRYNGKPVVFDE